MAHPVPYSIKRHGTTLETCDQEPVQTPGCIQAHGVLLVLRPRDLVILQASENSASLLGREPESLLDLALENIFEKTRIEAIHAALAHDPVDHTPFHLFVLPKGESGASTALQATLHTTDGLALLELEPGHDGVLPDYYTLVRRSLTSLQGAETLKELTRVITDEVRRETGLDRAMVYFFHADGSGEVIAESSRDDLGSWLGWRYPAHDIPQPARDIFRKIWSRPVPDIYGTLAEMVPLLNPETQRPLDMTYCALRGPSLMYTEYLANMGVGAALTLPLIVEGELWGLVACHHYTPIALPHHVRAAGEFLARAASQQIRFMAEREASAYRARLENVHYALIGQMTVNPEFTALTEGTPNLLTALDAGGAALCCKDGWHTVGNCPSPAQLDELGRWLAQQPELDDPGHSLFSTDSLSSLFAPAEAYASPCSGVLAIRYARERGSLILWFRPETLQTFTWAGNPNDLPLTAGPHGPRLTPRKSFEIWRETVRNRSLPWKKVEFEGVLKFRSQIIDLVVTRGEQLERLRSALELSRARFDISLDAAKLGAWDFNLATRTAWRTPRHDLIFGYDEMLPNWNFDTFQKHLPPEDRDAVVAEFEKTFAAHRVFELELRIIDARNQSKWIWLYGTPVETDGNRGYVGLIGDITARKASEQIAQAQSGLRILRSAMAMALAGGTEEKETLSAWAQLLAAHLERSCVLVWFPDEAGTLRLQAAAGLTEEVRVEEIDLEKLSRQPASHAGSADRTAVPSSFRRAGFTSLATFPIQAEGRVLGFIAIGLRTAVVTGMAEEIRVQIDGVVQWLKRRDVERAFADSSERVRLAVEAGNMGSWDFYPKTGVVQWSDRCRELFGVTAHEPINYATFQAALHPDDRERVDAGVKAVFDPGTDGRFDMEFRTAGRNGAGERSIRSMGQCYFDESGQPTRFLGTVQDITEMVKARNVMTSRGVELQALVEERTAELTATIGELEAFSYSISHDMRSPLRAMQGFAQALLEEYGDKLDADGRHYLDRIERGARRLDLLIQDVLTYSRVAKGEIALTPVDLQPLVEEILQSHTEFHEPQATIRLQLAGVRVLAHEAFLSQIFSNLIGNAVKFQAAGTKPVVEIRAEPWKGMTRIWICDNGIGIDREHFQRIFQIFGRVYPDRKYEGTGIGLAIVKKAAERMSGEIGLESEAGRGTRFWFTLKPPP